MSHVPGSPAGSAPEAGLARRLEAEAVAVAASLAAACAWAAAGLVRPAPAAVPRIVLPTAHLLRVEGAPLAALLRLGGAEPVPVGTVRDCPETELEDALAAAAAGLLVVADGVPEVVAPARFLWRCRCAGRPALLLDPASGRWAAWADGGADLVLIDGAVLTGVASGILAGSAGAIGACREARAAAAAFAAPPAVLEALAAGSAAGEPVQR